MAPQPSTSRGLSFYAHAHSVDGPQKCAEVDALFPLFGRSSAGSLCPRECLALLPQRAREVVDQPRDVATDSLGGLDDAMVPSNAPARLELGHVPHHDLVPEG